MNLLKGGHMDEKTSRGETYAVPMVLMCQLGAITNRGPSAKNQENKPYAHTKRAHAELIPTRLQPRTLPLGNLEHLTTKTACLFSRFSIMIHIVLNSHLMFSHFQIKGTGLCYKRNRSLVMK